jgi:hypothetical protein
MEERSRGNLVQYLVSLHSGGAERENVRIEVKHQEYKYENEQEHSDNIITTQGQRNS